MVACDEASPLVHCLCVHAVSVPVPCGQLFQYERIQGLGWLSFLEDSCTFVTVKQLVKPLISPTSFVAVCLFCFCCSPSFVTAISTFPRLQLLL